MVEGNKRAWLNCLSGMSRVQHISDTDTRTTRVCEVSSSKETCPCRVHVRVYFRVIIVIGQYTIMVERNMLYFNGRKKQKSFIELFKWRVPYPTRIKHWYAYVRYVLVKCLVQKRRVRVVSMSVSVSVSCPCPCHYSNRAIHNNDRKKYVIL